jgi:capsid protein
MEHVDPAKEANAQATRLASHTTSLAAEYARVGKDWDTELRQIAKEQELMRKLNIQSAESITQNKEEDNAE